MSADLSDPDGLVAEIEQVGARLSQAREMVGRRIIGQDAAVEQVLSAWLVPQPVVVHAMHECGEQR